MIEELHIRGLGVIEDVSLSLAPGLTVVTGETGAGKTMIVTALELLLGARASSDLVRSGAPAALVEAVLTPPDPQSRPTQQPAMHEDVDDAVTVEDPWSWAEDGVLLVSREIPSDGRSRARIGGRLVPVSALGELLGGHVEVHGQHEHVRLARADVQRRLLDRFAGDAHQETLARYGEAYAQWRAAERRRALLSQDAQAREDRRERLAREVSEIDALAIDVEQDARLETDLERLENAEALREVLDLAVRSLGDDGAGGSLASALHGLRRAPTSDPDLLALVERLTSSTRDLSETAADLAIYAEDVEADEQRLGALQLRKRDLTALMRRFGATVTDVVRHREDAARELAELGALVADAAHIDDTVRAALEAVLVVGAQVGAGRRQAATALELAVGGHLAGLALAHAKVEVRVSDTGARQPGPDGLDDVDVLLAANPGEPATRLSEGASGGERSRVALAIEVALADADEARVLVFDEVDAGVGGSTALALGEQLARLAHASARPRQVLCVTHLAQVAAFADVHHVVEKHVVEGRTVTSVRQVAASERVAELSRMLGGEATADAGLDHARGLLEAALSRRAV